MLPVLVKRVTTEAKSLKHVGRTCCKHVLKHRPTINYGTDVLASRPISTTVTLYEGTDTANVPEKFPSKPSVEHGFYNRFKKARENLSKKEKYGNSSTLSASAVCDTDKQSKNKRTSTPEDKLPASLEVTRLDSALNSKTDLDVQTGRETRVLSTSFSTDLTVDEGEDHEVDNLDPNLPPVYINLPLMSESFADYVDHSPILSKLVHVGVDLSRLDGKTGNYLLRLNFERDVQPYLLFLKDTGINERLFGHVLTVNPNLMKNSLDDIQTRVNYLKYRKFTDANIQKMVIGCPRILNMEVLEMDAKLGLYQKLFYLTGDEVRQALVTSPYLMWSNVAVIEETLYDWGELMGFTVEEKKKLLLCPYQSVLLSKKEYVDEVFRFAHGVMGLSHAYMAQFTEILHSKPLQLKQRHDYLMHLGIAQYDPKKENFVSMKVLTMYTDKEFSEKVARTSLKDFYDYLKTL